MLRWQTKLENCGGVSRRIELEGERTMLCLECEPRMLLLNSHMIILETTKLERMSKGLNQSQNTNLALSSVHAI
jgi:hypothetical protein